ncbi:hypothetical protein [Alteribacillus sp. HJP-4]|uniref:hypothetical protein n=1 Tax=Alteribacillus sp. HJP-4 TaxID=2775394 RepID=UPI0035CCE3BE
MPAVKKNFVTWHAVREDNVIGYRIYKEKEEGEFEHVDSISAHERKSYTESNNMGAYYVTTVDEGGLESAPSIIVE